MLGRRKKHRSMILFFVFLTLLVALCSITFIVKAQNVDEIDTLFETARGQLLGVYNSEVVSHAGIILGLIVAFASIAPNLWKALNSKRVILRFLAIFVPLLIIILLFYSVGRLFYWSGASVMGATRSNIGVSITASNATSCMGALANFTISRAMNVHSITTYLASFLHPNNWGLLSLIGGVIIVIPSIIIAWYDPFHKKENSKSQKETTNRKQNHKNL
jgi:hypothetical protein